VGHNPSQLRASSRPQVALEATIRAAAKSISNNCNAFGQCFCSAFPYGKAKSATAAIVRSRELQIRKGHRAILERLTACAEADQWMLGVSVLGCCLLFRGTRWHLVNL